MKDNNGIFKRILSLFLVVCMLVGLPQIVSEEVFAASSYPKTSDPSTMNSWSQYFGPNVPNTEHAGYVWTDKSVFTSASAFSNYGISMDGQNSFLTALSLMASTKEVKGYTNIPTDTMLILDLSSSMYDRGQGYSTVQTMANAVNATITDLLNTNVNNRVGLCVYFGGPNVWDMPDIESKSSSLLLLPLGRYKQAQNKFFDITANGTELYSFNIAAGVTNEAGVTMSGAHIVPEIAGTNMQWGLLDALLQFELADTKVPMNSPSQPGVSRLPVFVLMTDGVPTAASHRYTEQADFELGHNYVADRHAAQTDFLTQLTAAYVKAKTDLHYKDTTPLFYTLSLGVEISEDINNPSREYDARCDAILANKGNYDQATIDKAQVNSDIRKHWHYMIKDGGFAFIGIERYKKYTYEKEKIDLYGTSVDIGSDKGLFPWSEDQRFYVDQAFSAAQANNLADAFGKVVEQIGIQSKYHPTLVEGDEDTDGYITFTDNIGKYMEVTDVKGIVFEDSFFSGAELASNFSSGSFSPYNSFSEELIEAVKNRLGITNNNTATNLIKQAVSAGQLKYTSVSNYSNYIGWFADSSGNYLGFWDGTEQSKQNPGYISGRRPAYAIKSYGYLGAVNEALGIGTTDMMYADVQIRENISTGEQTVIFAVPAALVPTVTYDVQLDKYDGVESVSINGLKHPIRLIYEVALDSAINENTLLDGKTVDSEYIRANSNADGSVNFYTNAYEVDNSTGYGKVNANSYFRPSHENDTYYFQENSTIYVRGYSGYSAYSGYSSPSTSGDYYSATKVYYGGSSPRVEYVYTKLSSEALAVSLRSNDGTWYVPKGTVHVDYSDHIRTKSSNPTNTLPYASLPFVDVEGHGINDYSHYYVVGATLGNNGKITVTPVTGIKISKTVEGVQGGADEFSFTISSNRESYGSYSATKTDANGNQTSTTVRFSNGIASVSLKNGESILITGINAGNTYVITENVTDGYILKSVNGNTSATSATVTTQAGKISEAAFVNAVEEKGNLTVSKVVNHNLGDDYELTHDQSFTINITLTGSNVANKTFSIRHTGNPTIASLTTDYQGKFPAITLKDGEIVSIINIPVGVVATVTESNVPKGFAVSYLENKVSGDGVIAISKGDNNVDVVNRYTVEGEETVTINGTKELIGKNLRDDDFTFILENVETKDKISKTNVNGAFGFDLTFTKDDIGTHNYTLYEVNGGKGGITYDTSVYNIKVTVSDNGEGGISVESVMTKDGKTEQVAAFVNRYTVEGEEEVTINGTKELIGKDLKDGDFTFVLENEEGKTLLTETNKNGKFEFVLNFTEDDIGTHNYTVYEVNDGKGGITYDTSVYNVTVTVSDNGEGGISVESVMTKDGKTEQVAAFVNRYTVKGEEEVTINGTKELIGKKLRDDDFTFVLENVETKETISKTNVNGEFSFTLWFNQDDIGTHNYTLYEVNGGLGGITYDTTVYNVVVTVSDNGNGGITVESVMTKDGVAVQVAAFVNVYTVEGEEEVVINGTKELIGKDLKDGDFTFILENEEGKTLLTETNKNGKFEFVLNFTQDDIGTHNYTIREIGGNKGGITYDKSVYNVTVTVSDNGNGGIAVESVMTKDGDVVTTAEFVNRYTVEGQEDVVINGTKELIGKDLKDGDFTFILENIETEETISKTNANGTFSFVLTFTQNDIGTHNYKVYEVNGGLGGITYDTAVYNVVVTVSDNGNGGITVESVMTKEGVAVQVAEFVNVYTVEGEEEVVINGTKELIGKDLKDGDFTFELKNEAEGLILTETNKDGRFEFVLNFTEDDIGTHNYTLYEVNDGKGGITYDTSVYNIKVTVSDNGEGGIEVVTTITKDGVATQTAEFVNVYTVEGQEDVVINGTKELIGKDLKDGDFTFILENIETEETISKTNKDGKFEFVLTFTQNDIGTHNYKVYEVNGGLGGITYDTAVYNVVVTVSDNGNGGITVESVMTKDGVAVQVAEFVNVYTVEGEEEVVIEGTKELIGKDLKDGDFTFELKNEAEGLILTETNKDGRFEFVLNFTEDDIGTHNYTLYEANDGKGGITYDISVYNIKVTVSDNGEGGIEVVTTITKDGVATQTAEFVNRYTVEGQEDVVIEGTKELIGKDLKDGDFTFILENIETEETISKTNKDGKFEFVLTFTQNDIGTHNYKVYEVNGGLGGITYDTAVYNVVVTVSDNGNGGITVESVMTKDGEAVQVADFVNVYTVEGEEEVVIEGTKELIGKDLKDGDFTFILENVETEETISKTNKDGKFEFVLTFTQNDIGTHNYKVYEVNGGLGGITYDTAVYNVVVTVSDNGNGGITVESVMTKDGEAVQVAEFVNRYTVEGEEEVVINGTKELIGKDLKDGDFTFILENVETEETISKTNKDGKFEFVLTFTQNDIGTHNYKVYEVNGGLGGITYDTAVYNVVVTVSDNGNGGITVESVMTKDSEAVTSADFVNRYTVEGQEDVVIEGTKELIGKDLKDGDFTFILENTETEETISKANKDGKFEFVLTFTQNDIGTHNYKVYEVNGGLGGITYDTAVYNVVVTVSDNGNGGITVESVMTKDGDVVTTAEFVNRYTVEGEEEVVINGTKELIGKDLKDGDFTFILENVETEETISKTNANGTFSFVLTFTQNDIGTHNYKVYEVNGGLGGITYDTAVYNVVVTVSDNGNGGITVESVMTKDGNAVQIAEFVNRYTVEGEDSVVINGTKELIGKELSDGEFTFELKDKADGTIFSVKNENGTFKFVLNYTEADVGKVFEYELYEVNDGAERVTYDESVYNVVVTVSDDQNGNIVTEATITKDGIETTECSFTNVYTPKPDDITVNINVNKVVENIGAGEIGPEGFEFILENIATGEKTSVFSDENGNAMFTLAYSEADIGNRYSYKVYEINDGRENVTYSDVVYNITVSVTLGEDNKLYATVLNGEEATDDAVCEFVNVYNELPPAKPGDTSKTITWMIVLISSACGLSVAYAYGKKKKEDEE